MEMLTDKEKRILDIIRNYIEKNKISPTTRELVKLSGLNSTSTMHNYLSKLEKKNCISRMPGCPRSIKIVE